MKATGADASVEVPKLHNIKLLILKAISNSTHYNYYHDTLLLQCFKAASSSVRPGIEAERSPSSYIFDLLQFTHVACGL